MAPRAPRRSARWLAASAAVLAATFVAPGAEARPAGDTKVFPLSGTQLPGRIKDAPEVLTDAIARKLDADVASVPIEDAAGLIECELTARSCVAAVADSVGAKRIVFGTVTGRAGGGATVRLRWYEDGGAEDDRSFVLTADTSEQLADQLVRRIEGVLTEGKPEPIDPPKPPNKPVDKPVGKPPRDPGTTLDPFADPIDRPGGTSTGTWALVIGGGAATATGVALLIAANNLHDDVDNAPTENRDDFDDLLAIERAGKLRARIGGALVIAGGLATTYGIVRMFGERKRGARERTSVQLVPERGGASFVFSGVLR